MSARVKLGFPANGAYRKAEVRRISDTVDPETRSIGVIVEVPNPYADIEPGRRPPLIKGMFAEVELRGRVADNMIVLPRSAIRNSRVMIVNAEERLAFENVEIAYAFGDLAIIEEGIEAGSSVVISDLSPAIPAMLLDPIFDTEASERLAEKAMPSENMSDGDGQ